MTGSKFNTDILSITGIIFLVMATTCVANDAAFDSALLSSYARVQYANNDRLNTTNRRYNIQRDPTIRYVSFDELYNKNNQQLSAKIPTVNDRTGPAVSMTGSENRTATKAQQQAEKEAIENIHRRWEEAPDLGNGWTVERTSNLPSTTTHKTVAAVTSSEDEEGTEKQTSPPRQEDYIQDLLTSATMEEPKVSRPTTTSSTREVMFTDSFSEGAAEYAHAIGDENFSGAVTDQTTNHQPVVMEASWTEQRPGRNDILRSTRPVTQDRIDNDEPPLAKVSVKGPPQFSSGDSQMANSGIQSAWRPFVGPSAPQMNPNLAARPQPPKPKDAVPVTPSSVTNKIGDTTAAGTLFYTDALNKIVNSAVKFQDDNRPPPPPPAIAHPIPVFLADSLPPKVTQPDNKAENQPVRPQVLMIPNAIDNDIKVMNSMAALTPGGVQPQTVMTLPNNAVQGVHRPQTSHPNGPQFPGHPMPPQFNFNHQNNQNGQQRPPPFGMVNGQNMPPLPPRFGQQGHQAVPPQFLQKPNEQKQHQMGRPTGQNNRMPFGIPNQHGDQRPPQFQPLTQFPTQGVNNQNNPRPQVVPQLDQTQRPVAPFGHFAPSMTNANKKHDVNFVSIANSQETNRVPTGPVGLPPQLIPQVPGQPTNTPQQGIDSMTIPLLAPRPTGQIGTSINNPLPGPPVPLPGIPSGPIVIANVPPSNNGIQANADRNGANGQNRPNFNMIHINDRNEVPDNFLIQNEQVPFAQINPNVPPNFRPPHFLPPRGPPPPPQPTSSSSLLKTFFSKLFPFARSLNGDDVPIVDSDSLANLTTLAVDSNLYETIARSAGNSSHPFVIDIDTLLNDDNETTTNIPSSSARSFHTATTAHPIVNTLTKETTLPTTTAPKITTTMSVDKKP